MGTTSLMADMDVKRETQLLPQTVGIIPLGYTIPALLDAACDRSPNATAFNQWTGTNWTSLSNQTFRETVESVALGLLDLGLRAGDRVALLLHSDLSFAIADMGCLLANLVTVPIDLTQTLENIIYVIQHSGSRALIVSTLDLLQQIGPYLGQTAELQQIIVVDLPTGCLLLPSLSVGITAQTATPEPDTPAPPLHCFPECTGLDLHQCLHLTYPDWRISLPADVQICALTQIQAQGEIEKSAATLADLRSGLSPHDLATIIYIPGPAGELLGVMLSHENLTGNAMAAFAELPDLAWGAAEVALSFLPLNHVFARHMLYGHIYYGHSLYFSQPNWVFKHLAEVKPTILTVVPLLLEKIYSQILKRGKKLKVWKRLVFGWSLWLARHYQLGQKPHVIYAGLLKLADWLVLSQWRSPFGGRLKYLLCGGAALGAELANVLTAAGIPILQGYGLTQAGGVVSFNRGVANRAGTVGLPIAGVEVKIADDGEILVRSPYMMSGYDQHPEATKQDIDAQGWLHTGDLGRITSGGLLQITGLKKPLFKLSTGKYIAPLPIENRLKQSTFVAEAIIVGADRKFSAVLIFPNTTALQQLARELGLNLSGNALLQHPCIVGLYRALVESVNCHLPYWAIVKRFQLIHTELRLENGLPISHQQLDRQQVLQCFAQEIDNLFREGSSNNTATAIEIASTHSEEFDHQEIACPVYPVTPCPVFAQSLDIRQEGSEGKSERARG